uniref:Uncharacterized protein n=1 Tax=Oryza nivara TaxID=4536 RepID=A0A0E0I4T5_ORYNI
MLLDEQLHLHHELAGVGELRERVEAMDGVRVLHHPHRLPLLAQRRHVPRLPSLEQVEPADHHHRRRERLRQLDALAAAHARRRVVPGGALRQELPPEVVRPRQRQREARLVEPHLLLRPLLAAEEGRYQHGAGEPERRGRGRRRRSPALRHVVRDVPARADPAGDAAAERVADAAARGGGGGGPSVRDVVGDVAAGAVADEEAAGEVDGDGGGDFGGEADGAEVAEHVHAVVVGGGVAVLGGEAVVDGDDDGAELAAEPAAQGVVLAGGGGEEREAAAVEVDDDGERRGLHGAAARRGEHARPQPAGGVDGDVAGADAVGVRARRGGALAVGEGEEEAVDGAIAALHEVDGGDESEELEPHRPRQRRRLGPPELVAGRFLLLLVPHFAGFCASQCQCVEDTIYR